MILVRQPHCWRFLFPLAGRTAEPTARDDSRRRCCASSGRCSDLEILNTHRLPDPPPHRQRVAARPRVPDGRRRASDHADVGARAQHRHPRCDQPAVAARLGGARLGDRCAARRLRRANSIRSRRRAPAKWPRPARKYMLGQKRGGARDVGRARWANAHDPHHARRAARRRSVRRLVDGEDRRGAAARRRPHAGRRVAWAGRQAASACTI